MTLKNKKKFFDEYNVDFKFDSLLQLDKLSDEIDLHRVNQHELEFYIMQSAENSEYNLKRKCNQESE